MHVLIAVDLTDQDCTSLVELAGGWLSFLGAKADLLFVDEAQDQHPWIPDGQLRALMSRHYAEWHEGLQPKLTELLDRLPAPCRGEAHVVRGRAIPTLLNELKRYDAIVLGNRPAAGLQRLAHGVVAERVSQQSTKPVLMLPSTQA